MREREPPRDIGRRTTVTIAVAFSLTIGACVAQPAPIASALPVVATAAPTIVPPPLSASPVARSVRCRAADLRIRAGRDGESGVVHIGATISNLGRDACTLPVVPARIELVQGSGTALDLLAKPSPGDPAARIAIQPGIEDGAHLIAFWMNWCGGEVGPLELRVTFDPGDADVRAPLEGSLVARCDNPAQPSAIQIDSVTAVSP